MPVLGICRGREVLKVARGRELVLDTRLVRLLGNHAPTRAISFPLIERCWRKVLGGC